MSDRLTVRCFIAVLLPDALREAIARQTAPLRAAGDVRWVAPEQYHLTLKFLGETDRTALDRVAEQLERIAKTRSHFMVELEGTGAFPGLSRPRVVWLGVGAGAEELRALAAAVEDGCAAAGLSREDRPFRSHLTLGRVRSPRGLPGLTEALRQARVGPFEPFPVREIALMRSELRPGGAIYTALARFPLSGQESGEEQGI